jgi:Radical SAM superfamily
MIDILICSLPSGIINRAPAAPALLKACVEQAGFSARTTDFSLSFYINQCHKDFNVYSEEVKLFENYTKFEMTKSITNWLDDVCEIIVQHQPHWVGLSVFSTHQHRATVLVCKILKEKFPNIKILLGGYGLSEEVGASFSGFTETIISNFDQYIKHHQLADYYIYGEGELEIINILNNTQSTITSVDLNQIPFSNFDDYQLDEYMWHTEPVLTVTSSKGCVRNCTFCNVPRKFGKFKRKSGQNVAQELIHLSQRYNVTKFEFTDSLVNGSLKDFQEWIEIIADYNNKQPIKHRISWYGQYICRPQAQIPIGMYETIKQSGAVNLIIGAESGSNDVLEAMNKKITRQDILNELEQFDNHGLKAQLLMLNGFYNETWERYIETLHFIASCHRYTASGTVTKIAVGFPLIIEPGGHLQQHAEQLGIIIDPNDTFNWKTKHDSSNDFIERMRRRIITQEVLNFMNVSMTINGINELKEMSDQIKLYEQQLISPNSKTNFRFSKLSAH